MKPFARAAAFSLVEVIIAVGLFAGSVAVIIGLVSTLTRQAADSADVLAAHRLPDAIKVELRRLAGPGFDGLAGRIPVMPSRLHDGFALVATREATRVHSLNFGATAALIPSARQYFLVECWRFPTEPLSFGPQKAFLALHVRVSWPYRVPGSPAPVALPDRTQVAFTVSLLR